MARNTTQGAGADENHATMSDPMSDLRQNAALRPVYLLTELAQKINAHFSQSAFISEIKPELESVIRIGKDAVLSNKWLESPSNDVPIEVKLAAISFVQACILFNEPKTRELSFSGAGLIAGAISGTVKNEEMPLSTQLVLFRVELAKFLAIATNHEQKQRLI